SALLLAAIAYVGDAGDTSGLRSTIGAVWRAVGIHGLIALSYAIWPKKAPEAGEDAAAKTSAVAARHPEHVPDLAVRGPRQDEEQV
ncbi:hypothetical protein ACFV5C_36060, partial [Streptomyces sp. NPDC059762]